MSRLLSIAFIQLGASCFIIFLAQAQTAAPANPYRDQILQAKNALLVTAAVKAVAGVSTIEANMTKYLASVDKCTVSREESVAACDETKSGLAEKIHGLGQEYGTLVTAVGTSFTNDACFGMGNMMRAANLALQMYQGACQSAKSTCDSSCGSAAAAVKYISAAASGVITSLNTAATAATTAQKSAEASQLESAAAQIAIAQSAAKSEISDTGNEQTVIAKRNYCAVQAAQAVASGGQQAMIAMQLATQGLNCTMDSKTKTATDSSEGYCSMNPMAAQCNCELTNQKVTQRCICEKNPRVQGCANSLAKSGAASDGEGLKVGGGLLSQPSEKPIGGGLPPEPFENAKIDIPKTAGGAEGPAGGAMSGGGAGAGAGAANQMDKPGGGGGAQKGYQSALGGWGSSSSGSGNYGTPGRGSNSKDPLGKYGPGQPFDPRRKISSITLESAQLSSGGGRSNWEKIKIRYSEEKPRLIGK